MSSVVTLDTRFFSPPHGLLLSFWGLQSSLRICFANLFFARTVFFVMCGS